MDKAKTITITNAEEEHLSSKSMKTVTRTKKNSKLTRISIQEEVPFEPKAGDLALPQEGGASCTLSQNNLPNVAVNDAEKKKSKSKKNKLNKANISLKSSLGKFDALQKLNLIHNPEGENGTNCRICSKAVFKMEEIKAEKSVFHRTCFRCKECSKQLKVDNYRSHGGQLYCLVHFKLLFVPKCVEGPVDEERQKPELIIRENEPDDLPPDIVRASNKPDLGLEELKQLNVRSRFQVFEYSGKEQPPKDNEHVETSKICNCSTSILTKLAKLQAAGVSAGIDPNEIPNYSEQSDSNGEEKSSFEDGDEDDKDGNVYLMRHKKHTHDREQPLGIGRAMEEIKLKFEKGPLTSREERREERKQELKNIRSRLFAGKQARLKELYEQAVADTEQSMKSAGKKPDIDVEGTARLIKERFEKGELWATKDENESKEIQKDADLFESAIAKNSRSIFLELDANIMEEQSQRKEMPRKHTFTTKSLNNSSSDQENLVIPVKCGETFDDPKIETSEISSKFKFFETYQPIEKKKKEFRITPPREGVVKLPSPDGSDVEESSPRMKTEISILDRSQTTSNLLNKFRELEMNAHNTKRSEGERRPLKCFTPPPDDNLRVSDSDETGNSNSSGGSDSEPNEEDYCCRSGTKVDDEALREAKQAARAKKLREKFEKWEASQEKNENYNNEQQEINETTETIESTKSIRERFENLQTMEHEKVAVRPRYQVNRFV